MLRKRFLLVPLVLLTLLFYSCSQEDFPVKLLEIDDTGTAIFTIENKTEKDVASLTTSLTYFSEEDRALKIDTVDWAMGDKSQAFLRAGEQTYIAQTVAEGTTSATGKVISYKFME